MTERDSENGGCEERGASERTGRSRRTFLKVAGSTAGLMALAGCSGGQNGASTTTGTTRTTTATSTSTPTDTATPTGEPTATTNEQTETQTATQTPVEPENIEEWRGSGPLIEDRPDRYPGGTSIQQLEDLSGEVTIYLGGGEGGLYVNLVDRFEEMYDDFSAEIRRASSSQLANTIIEETSANRSPADLFWAIDAGSVGVVASNGATTQLPDPVVSEIPQTFHPNNQWVGVMGRARSIPFNTNEFSAGDVPQDIFAFTSDSRFENAMGWAPTYGAFQSFITSMRVLNGDRRTRQWLQGMLDQGIEEYGDEHAVANAVADGELSAGFSNHYYSRLVYEERPDAPLELAFTRGDAGSLINCSAIEILRGSRNKATARNLIRHLLTIEAQEFLTTRGYGYPLVPSVPPVGDLPTIDQLNPPDLDLGRLSDVEPTLQLLRDVGVL